MADLVDQSGLAIALDESLNGSQSAHAGYVNGKDH